MSQQAALLHSLCFRSCLRLLPGLPALPLLNDRLYCFWPCFIKMTEKQTSRVTQTRARPLCWAVQSRLCWLGNGHIYVLLLKGQQGSWLKGWCCEQGENWLAIIILFIRKVYPAFNVKWLWVGNILIRWQRQIQVILAGKDTFEQIQESRAKQNNKTWDEDPSNWKL